MGWGSVGLVRLEVEAEAGNEMDIWRVAFVGDFSLAVSRVSLRDIPGMYIIGRGDSRRGVASSALPFREVTIGLGEVVAWEEGTGVDSSGG